MDETAVRAADPQVSRFTDDTVATWSPGLGFVRGRHASQDKVEDIDRRSARLRFGEDGCCAWRAVRGGVTGETAPGRVTKRGGREALGRVEAGLAGEPLRSGREGEGRSSIGFAPDPGGRGRRAGTGFLWFHGQGRDVFYGSGPGRQGRRSEGGDREQ